MTAPVLTLEVLKKQNAETSAAVIDLFNDDIDFMKLATYEGRLTAERDEEDGEKLQRGIDYAKAKGVIDPNYIPEPYVPIDVLGKSPDQVADEILSQLRDGNVLVLVGLSGTGKGTTVSSIRHKLETIGKKVVTWSNGNIFRSVTLLAVTWCEQNGCDDALERAMTRENIESFMKMIHFTKNDTTGQFDTRINGLGLDLWVSQIENTILKSPQVSRNIPTVAEFTQGEIILFAADAARKMAEDGQHVLIEGREQTVDHVRTPHRFMLTLSDESLIGKRRAAQRLMGAALTERAGASDDDQGIEPALRAALTAMVKDI